MTLAPNPRQTCRQIRTHFRFDTPTVPRKLGHNEIVKQKKTLNRIGSWSAHWS